MNKEDMVVGREYLHCESVFDKTYVFKSVISTTSGRFKGPISNVSHDFTFSNMSEAKLKFEFNDEIEVGCCADFTDDPTEGKFKHLDPEGNYWIADKDGQMMYGRYARKVEPMVTGYINSRQYSATKEMWKVFYDATDKIIAGDFNV